MNSFSLEQQAGQRLMVGFDGTELDGGLKELIDTVKVGGVILFAENVINPDQIGRLCASIQDYAKSCGQPPLFVSIDQEGGKVARLAEPFTQFPGNPSMREESDAVRFADQVSSELGNVGINMNLAPVLDVAVGNESIMAERAFGNDPAWVAKLGGAVIRRLQQNGVMAVAKHFPGIGRTVLDSHLEMPDLEIAMDDLESVELPPFTEAIRCGVAAIMLSHIRYTDIDPEWPASLSETIIRDLLRNQMGFDGVVMTDDLDMHAIRDNYDLRTSVHRILKSDADIVLICHEGPNIGQAFEEICTFSRDSATIREMGAKSVQRLLDLKREYLACPTGI